MAVDLFTEFHVAPNADCSNFGGAEVKVIGVAIQSAGFADDINDGEDGTGTTTAVQEAWAAVIATYPYIYVPRS